MPAGQKRPRGQKTSCLSVTPHSLPAPACRLLLSRSPHRTRGHAATAAAMVDGGTHTHAHTTMGRRMGVGGPGGRTHGRGAHRRRTGKCGADVCTPHGQVWACLGGRGTDGTGRGSVDLGPHRGVCRTAECRAGGYDYTRPSARIGARPDRRCVRGTCWISRVSIHAHVSHCFACFAHQRLLCPSATARLF